MFFLYNRKIYIVGDLAFITYGHHALIAGNRKGAIDGVIITIILAILFTGLQYFEYSFAGFTMSDGVYGSAFYASTGLHGLVTIVPIKLINKNMFNSSMLSNYYKNININKINTLSSIKKDNLLINFNKEHSKEQKEFLLKSEFLDWFTGFTDAEGNFNITLRKLNENNYTSAMLTFQICLHIDDLFILEYIKNKINCGHISISTSKCNYFINDKDSLFQILLPIFNFIKLNSSKYYQFIIFEKAVNFVNEKKHLSKEGKLEMIKFYHEMKNPYLAPPALALRTKQGEFNNSPLTKHWLGGFTDGDASFSIFNYKPRLRFENHIKELELFNRIKDFFNISNNLNITPPRLDRPNSNATVNLDNTDIQLLKKCIVPLYSKDGILRTKKLKDFSDWSFVVDIYYFGYHLLPEGKLLIKEIKNSWNNFRLSTHYLNNKDNLCKNSDFKDKFKTLFLLSSPYEIKNGIRFIRGTNNLVSFGNKIIRLIF